MQFSILLLSAERRSVQPLATALTSTGHSVTVVTRPDEAVKAAAGYSLMMIDSVTAPATSATNGPEARALSARM